MKERQNRILDALTKHEKLEVKELAEMMEVSQVTIRKDLDALTQQGLIIRNHGYATLNNSDDMNNRLAYHYEMKQRIAKKVCEDIHDGETIMIESGSCCALVALEIAQSKKNITIITNSAFIADYIRNEDIKVILLGGEYQASSQVLVGPITINNAKNFFVDKYFIGADGFSEKSGFTGKDYLRAETVREMAKQAAHVIVVTESEKFGHIGTVNLLDTNNVAKVYTDTHIPQEDEIYLNEMNVEVIKVD
ncbi:DeoR/GlpR family DNA-binding transcription regulator [Sharpea azabuensis]|uniref:DeoR/GlpR family DNA-binding transcription regulator n=1 Tax=Sharpea azabuensis TaxID=322505 RepID=UPI00240A8FBA|nr:DeoR/GlpR family DNA-binding transcription regulator [Sharpea azabuensis]MDD6513796.1 DeoR/GlpR family DNA-binding transcription regulator [Sharpea azabuensis]